MDEFKKERKEKEARKQYGEYRIRYKLDMDDDRFFELNRKYQEPLQEALAAVGVVLEIKDGDLKISLNPELYERKKSRHAGRNERFCPKVDDEFHYYKYSDIVVLMQTMSDRDLAAHTNIPIATFYRHKKKMMESYFYRQLDMDRLDDVEYLRSVPGDNLF